MADADASVDINELDSRVRVLESFAANTVTGLSDAYTDPEAEATVTNDPLDWTVSTDWESYTTIGPPITDPADPVFPGGALSSLYGMPAAYRVGSMCVLTGLVRRKGGSANLPAGASATALPMFALPQFWQSTSNIILPCLMGNTDPSGTAVVGTAWIEVRGDLTSLTGVVHYRAGTVACNAGVGWIALQGLFPISVADSLPTVEGSWNDASETMTWDMFDDTVTWNSYPDPAS
jgi:hypothetical protein